MGAKQLFAYISTYLGGVAHDQGNDERATALLEGERHAVSGHRRQGGPRLDAQRPGDRRARAGGQRAGDGALRGEPGPVDGHRIQVGHGARPLPPGDGGARPGVTMPGRRRSMRRAWRCAGNSGTSTAWPSASRAWRGVAVAQRHLERAARLLGAAEALRQATGAPCRLANAPGMTATCPQCALAWATALRGGMGDGKPCLEHVSTYGS